MGEKNNISLLLHFLKKLCIQNMQGKNYISTILSSIRERNSFARERKVFSSYLIFSHHHIPLGAL